MANIGVVVAVRTDAEGLADRFGSWWSGAAFCFTGRSCVTRPVTWVALPVEATGLEVILAPTQVGILRSAPAKHSRMGRVALRRTRKTRHVLWLVCRGSEASGGPCAWATELQSPASLIACGWPREGLADSHVHVRPRGQNAELRGQ